MWKNVVGIRDHRKDVEDDEKIPRKCVTPGKYRSVLIFYKE